jgi:thiol-disulfide isomerase/thioredoxin
MTIQRLSNKAFEQIMAGKTKTPVSCVIKLYSNTCHLCRALKEPYEEVAKSFDDVHFFAFNADESPPLEEHLGVNGVPSIIFVRTGARPHIDVLKDPPPDKTHSETWYHLEDIKNFIERNHNG